ncbi:MAG: hypothetical protein Fues2KO_06910 [Fuerstiella sp.]|jgi:hypothetical protein
MAKKIIIGVIAASAVAAFGLTEVPTTLDRDQDVAVRYHLRNRTRNFYKRATRSRTIQARPQHKGLFSWTRRSVTG